MQKANFGLPLGKTLRIIHALYLIERFWARLLMEHCCCSSLTKSISCFPVVDGLKWSTVNCFCFSCYFLILDQEWSMSHSVLHCEAKSCRKGLLLLFLRPVLRQWNCLRFCHALSCYCRTLDESSKQWYYSFFIMVSSALNTLNNKQKGQGMVKSRTFRFRRTAT